MVMCPHSSQMGASPGNLASMVSWPPSAVPGRDGAEVGAGIEPEGVVRPAAPALGAVEGLGLAGSDAWLEGAASLERPFAGLSPFGPRWCSKPTGLPVA